MILKQAFKMVSKIEMNLFQRNICTVCYLTARLIESCHNFQKGIIPVLQLTKDLHVLMISYNTNSQHFNRVKEENINKIDVYI